MLRALNDLHTLHTAFGYAQGTLESRLGVPVCIPNCGICCQANVPGCMIIEGINMVSVLMGRGLLRKAVDIAHSWLLEKHPFATIYRGLPVGLVPRDINAEMAEISMSRCPFLDDDSKCIIHTCRPLVCQAFGVSIEGQGCPRPLGKYETSGSKGIFEATELRKLVNEFKRFHGQRKPEWVIRGFAPTLLYRAAEPDTFRGYVDDNRIASAKIIGSEVDVSLMWQPQVDALRRGVPADIVVHSDGDPERTLAQLRS